MIHNKRIDVNKAVFTTHAKLKLDALGRTVEEAKEVLRGGVMSAVMAKMSQTRYAGKGLCLVVEGDYVITVYKDMVKTPLRDDQKARGIKISRK